MRGTAMVTVMRAEACGRRVTPLGLSLIQVVRSLRVRPGATLNVPWLMEAAPA